MARRIDSMYWNYGYGEGFCHECQHFRKKCWNKKVERKVVGYDENGDEIVEEKSFLACGLKDKEFPGDVASGQVCVDELLNGG